GGERTGEREPADGEAEEGHETEADLAGPARRPAWNPGRTPAATRHQLPRPEGGQRPDHDEAHPEQRPPARQWWARPEHVPVEEPRVPNARVEHRQQHRPPPARPR